MLSWWNQPYIETKVMWMLLCYSWYSYDSSSTFHPDKISDLKENQNDKMKADLVRSYFDSMLKILELGIDNKVTFVVKMLDSDNLKHEFDNKTFVFYC